jgi:FkbM family methyltransferase
MAIIGKALATIRRIVRDGPRPQASPGEFPYHDLLPLLGKQNPVILDVGCNDGSQTLQFLNVFKRPRVYCFEPDSRAQRAFRENVQSRRVQVFEMALGNRDGMIDFHVSSGKAPPEFCFKRSEWDLSGSIRKPKQHLVANPWVSFEKTVPVKISRLDTWATNHGVKKVDFIWADVQGAEVDLIEGGRQTLNNTRFFYTEYNSEELYEGQINLEQILKMLPNFKVVQDYAGDVLLRNQLL